MQRCVIWIVLGALACGGPSTAPPPLLQNRMAPGAPIVMNPVRIIVRDYGRRLVEGARVSALVKGEVREATTDARGEAMLDAPRGTRVSATKHDMLGSGTVGPDPALEIEMAQMPM